MPANQIVVHRIDGGIVKGSSLDVDPKHPQCHVRTQAGESVEIAMADVKALFFVKSLAGGHPPRTDAKEAEKGDTRLVGARRVRIVFTDGEEIVGLMNRFPPITPYYFLLPIDPQSNNIRILVNGRAVRHIEEVTT